MAGGNPCSVQLKGWNLAALGPFTSCRCVLLALTYVSELPAFLAHSGPLAIPVLKAVGWSGVAALLLCSPQLLQAFCDHLLADGPGVWVYKWFAKAFPCLEVP